MMACGSTLQQPNASAWTQSYTHDAMGRLSAVTSPAGTFTYGYSGPSSLVTNLALPNGSRVTNSYDNMERGRKGSPIRGLRQEVKRCRSRLFCCQLLSISEVRSLSLSNLSFRLLIPEDHHADKRLH